MKYRCLRTLVTLVVIVPAFLAGCNTIRSSSLAISSRIHQANDISTEAYHKIDSGDYAGAVRDGEQILAMLDESNFFRDEMKYKAGIQRGAAWFLIGYAKLLKNSGGWDDVEILINNMGTPQGGEMEFKKALTVIDESQLIDHSFMAQINPYMTKARALTFLGRFELSTGNYEEAILWARDNGSNAPAFLHSVYFWRSLMWKLYGFDLLMKNPENLQEATVIFQHSIDDMESAKENTSSSESIQVLNDQITIMRDLLKEFK